MWKFLFRWVATSLTILMIPSFVSGVAVTDFGTALAAAAVLGILNTLVKPVLIFLTLPLTFLTLGLFLLVINALVFELAAALVGGMYVASFWSALGASLIVSVVSWAINSIGDNRVTFQVRRGPNGKRVDALDMHRSQDGKWE